jgi:hypothetical protein
MAAFEKGKVSYYDDKYGEHVGDNNQFKLNINRQPTFLSFSDCKL